MHKKIYDFVSDLETLYPLKKYHERHIAGIPIPITVIDNFLPNDIFCAVVEDIKNISKESYTIFSNDSSYRHECRDFKDATILQSLVNSFNSSKFIKWLESISGIEKLIPDPHLRGGGLARINSGSKLGLHTDFNWNDQIRLNRKLNLIIYLTPNWESYWDGDLEFYNEDHSQCVLKVEPIANRLAFWNYESWLLHGNSKILNTPKNISRDNLIHFYYTSNAFWEEAPNRSKFY